jgi:hypothetical protein
MYIILGIAIGILLTIQLMLFVYCKHWCDNNPWKWFCIKCITSLSIIIYFVGDKDIISKTDLICSIIIAIAIGIDLALTICERVYRED